MASTHELPFSTFSLIRERHRTAVAVSSPRNACRQREKKVNDAPGHARNSERQPDVHSFSTEYQAVSGCECTEVSSFEGRPQAHGIGTPYHEGSRDAQLLLSHSKSTSFFISLSNTRYRTVVGLALEYIFEEANTKSKVKRYKVIKWPCRVLSVFPRLRRARVADGRTALRGHSESELVARTAPTYVHQGFPEEAFYDSLVGKRTRA